MRRVSGLVAVPNMQPDCMRAPPHAAVSTAALLRLRGTEAGAASEERDGIAEVGGGAGQPREGRRDQQEVAAQIGAPLRHTGQGRQWRGV